MTVYRQYDEGDMRAGDDWLTLRFGNGTRVRSLRVVKTGYGIPVTFRASKTSGGYNLVIGHACICLRKESRRP